MYKPFEERRYVIYAPLAQLDRALRYGRKGWGFESLTVYQQNRMDYVYPFLFIQLSAQLETVSP